MPIFNQTIRKINKKIEPESGRAREKWRLWAAHKRSKVEHGAIAKSGDLPTPKPACGAHHEAPAWGLEIKSREG